MAITEAIGGGALRLLPGFDQFYGLIDLTLVKCDLYQEVNVLRLLQVSKQCGAYIFLVAKSLGKPANFLVVASTGGWFAKQFHGQF